MNSEEIKHENIAVDLRIIRVRSFLQFMDIYWVTTISQVESW